MLLLIVFLSVFISLAVTRPIQIYHKWKIVKVTHKGNYVDYTVKRNGYLGMPFLYDVEKADFGILVKNKPLVGLSLQEANKLKSKMEEEYADLVRSKIVCEEDY